MGRILNIIIIITSLAIGLSRDLVHLLDARKQSCAGDAKRVDQHNKIMVLIKFNTIYSFL